MNPASRDTASLPHGLAPARRFAARLTYFLCLGSFGLGSLASAATAPLTLEYQVPLGDIRGRIDHLALDVARQRLFIAELGNDSLGIVDLRERRVLRTLVGLKEPQGVAYEQDTDTLFVANAGDGSVDLLRGPTYLPSGRLDLGSDADNVRIDAAKRQVLVGHSDGAISTIDASSGRVLGSIRLAGHPEGFELDPASSLVWVNIPDAHEIDVLDRQTGKPLARWPQKRWNANFPMALDTERHRLLVGFRQPSTLAVFDPANGQVTSAIDICGDADDIFVDARRHRLYVSCGEGYLDILDERGSGYARIARMPTADGARTAWYSPELDRMFLAVRATGGAPASVRVFRPYP